jgi:hypothetical protein
MAGTMMKESPMAQKTTPVRITDEAIKWARIASGYTGESMAEYVSRVVAERGREDTKRLHDETLRPGSAKPDPSSPTKPKR